MTGRIHGLVSVVTRGCSGIGRATVQRFAEEGAKVVGGDIDDANGHAIVEELGGADRARYVHVDVTDAAQVQTLSDTANDSYGAVDIAFDNAGISLPEDGSILETDPDAWRRVQEVNLTSVFLCCKAALGHMVEQGRGSIINTASFVAGLGAATSHIFPAIEGVPLAAEETRDPKGDMPRGLIAGMGVLLMFAALMFFFAPGGSGASAISGSGNPPVDALIAVDAGSGMTDFVNWVGLFGLIASFFSIILAYSRQLFALSRAGYLPKPLSITSGRKVPWIALILPALVGFLLAAFWEDQGARILNIAVFGAAVSYVLMVLSHIVLRAREPELERGYRTPGGAKTSGVALVLAVAAVVATFLADTTAALITLGVYLAAALYFGAYSRHHLVASAPEEFEAISKAEAELAGS